ncbi:Uncharacterised protein [Mycobacterium tuberculosis]|nr:Uncharacterised protein [Mycobacterium tuberculosis]
MGVGQVVPLGHALAQTVAENATLSQRELCLSGLVAGVLRIVFGVEPRPHPVGSVARGHRQDGGRDDDRRQ